MRQFGLIGRTLRHSFSAGYFAEKFERENISDCRYDLFELASIEEFTGLIEQSRPVGLNVTIPYKESVIPYLTSLEKSAERVGAVNVIHRKGEILTGYNSDYYGFQKSLQNWLTNTNVNALILGTGGASKAVAAVLEDMGISFSFVSRTNSANSFTYETLPESVATERHLWINTTPLGMSPDVHSAPAMPYSCLTPAHYLYDLVYNPEVTQFMKMGKSKGSSIKNGLEMLYLQAERSWDIWNS